MTKRVAGRGLCVLCVALLAAASVTGVAAQSSETTVGLLAGVARTDQQWSPPADGERYDGLVMGAFADAPTPAAWLAFRAEGGYAQRGGDVVLDVGGVPTPAGIRMGYLTVGVHMKFQQRIGPLTAHAAVGPMLEQVLSRRVDAVLAQVFESETPTVLSFGFGVGLGWWSGSGLFVGVDARRVEGLGDAHEGNFTSVRNRAWEALLRVGVPLARLRGG